MAVRGVRMKRWRRPNGLRACLKKAASARLSAVDPVRLARWKKPPANPNYPLIQCAPMLRGRGEVALGDLISSNGRERLTHFGSRVQ